MCKYCEYGVPLVNYINYEADAKVSMDIFAGEIRLAVDVDDVNWGRVSVEGIEIEKNIPIEFCPVCGRKLGL